jgi:hypothetical protein
LCVFTVIDKFYLSWSVIHCEQGKLIFDEMAQSSVEQRTQYWYY